MSETLKKPSILRKAIVLGAIGAGTVLSCTPQKNEAKAEQVTADTRSHIKKVIESESIKAQGETRHPTLDKVSQDDFDFNTGVIKIHLDSEKLEYLQHDRGNDVIPTLEWQTSHGLEKFRIRTNKDFQEKKKAGKLPFIDASKPTLNVRPDMSQMRRPELTVLLAPTANNLTKEIADSMNELLWESGMSHRYRIRPHITAAFRTAEYQAQLSKTNLNATTNPRGSAHERGNTFDMRYTGFDIIDMETNIYTTVQYNDKIDQKTNIITKADRALGKALYNMAIDNRIFVRREGKVTSCYHIVDRIPEELLKTIRK